MQGDNKNQGIVWCVSVMVLATYLLSDSTIVKGIGNTRKCGLFNLNTEGLGGAPSQVQIF